MYRYDGEDIQKIVRVPVAKDTEMAYLSRIILLISKRFKLSLQLIRLLVDGLHVHLEETPCFHGMERFAGTPCIDYFLLSYIHTYIHTYRAFI